MYIRSTKREYKGKEFYNYLLVESVTTKKGPRQKVIVSLGDLRPRPAKEWLKLAHKVESALQGEISMFDEPDKEVEEIVSKVREKSGKENAGSDVWYSEHDDERFNKEDKANNIKSAVEEPVRIEEAAGIEKTAMVEESARVEDSAMAEDPDSDLVAVHTNRVSTEEPREAGAVHVGHVFWKKLNLNEILGEAGMNKREILLTCAMTMNRLISPSSEHAMPGWMKNTAIGDILGIDFENLSDDSLYRNLDRLHPNRRVIEKALAERENDLFNLDDTVLLVDLTSTYFEGEAARNGKAHHGYSRDKRYDCKQVLISLVLNRDGFPRRHEVFDGNKRDSQTLGDILDSLDEKTGLQKGQTIVVDRGMSDDENLALIRSHGYHYIVASRQSERDRWLDDFEDEDGFEEVERVPSPQNEYQKKSHVSVKMKHVENGTQILCISDGRKEKDRAIREKKSKALIQDLKKLEKRIAEGNLVTESVIFEKIGRLKERYPRVARYFKIHYDSQAKKFQYSVDEEKRQKAEKLDGSYLLKTDRRDLTAVEAWRIYTLLTRVETAFRNMKTPLAEQPIFHQLERRVETHIFLCVLALHLLVAIEKTLLDQDVHTSWETIRKTLSTHNISTIVLPTDKNMTLKIRKASTPEKPHLELYNLLGITKEIIKPVRTFIKNIDYSD